MSKKLAIVTGGGSGIGRHTALALANQDIHVVIIGRNLEKLEETQSQALEGTITTLVADLSKPEQWTGISDQLPEGKIDFLVHNAATLGPFCNMSDLTLEQWRETIAVNAEAPLFLTQSLLPKLSEGRVLFVTSGAADIPLNHLGGYCCSKALLRMVKRMMAVDIFNKDIVCSAISPGVVDTNMQSDLREQTNHDFPAVGVFKQLAENGKLIHPDTVANYIAWLLLKADRVLYAATDEWNFELDEHLAMWKNDNPD